MIILHSHSDGWWWDWWWSLNFRYEMSTEVILIPVEEVLAKKLPPNSRVQESLQAHLLHIQSVELTFCTEERIFVWLSKEWLTFNILKLLHDSKAFWSFFYIWFGFLCAQVSSGNCEMMESWFKCLQDYYSQEFLGILKILTLKPQSHVRILICRTWVLSGDILLKKKTG